MDADIDVAGGAAFKPEVVNEAKPLSMLSSSISDAESRFDVDSKGFEGDFGFEGGAGSKGFDDDDGVGAE